MDGRNRKRKRAEETKVVVACVAAPAASPKRDRFALRWDNVRPELERALNRFFPRELLALVGDFHRRGVFAVLVAGGELYGCTSLGTCPDNFTGSGRTVSVGRPVDVYEGQFVDGNRQGRGEWTHIEPTPAEGDRVNYEGEWHEDRMHGRGRWKSGPHTYTGSFKNGVKEGWGKWVTSGGDTYVGAFVNDKRHGRGHSVVEDEDGPERYTGEWAEGARHGRGVLTSPKGCYDGDFRRNLRTGRATFYDALTGSRYDGQWMDGKRHGEGVERKANGSEYSGGFVNDKREGVGALRAYLPSCAYVHVGQFKAGKRHGTGRVTYDSGDAIEGTWERDLQVGRGTYTWSEGSIYEGEFKGSLLSGAGKLTWPEDDDKLEFSGLFRDDDRNGPGVLRFRDGGCISAQWTSDQADPGSAVVTEPGTSGLAQRWLHRIAAEDAPAPPPPLCRVRSKQPDNE